MSEGPRPPHVRPRRPQALRQSFEDLEHEDPFEALRAAQRLKREIPRFEVRLAAEALEAGATWEEVGEVLGITRQAAWEKFRGYLGPEAFREVRREVRHAGRVPPPGARRQRRRRREETVGVVPLRRHPRFDEMEPDDDLQAAQALEAGEAEELRDLVERVDERLARLEEKLLGQEEEGPEV